MRYGNSDNDGDCCGLPSAARQQSRVVTDSHRNSQHYRIEHDHSQLKQKSVIGQQPLRT